MGLDPGEADDDEQAYFRGSLASQSGKQADIYKNEKFLKKMRAIQLMRQGTPKGRALARAENEDLETLQQAYAGYKRKQAKGPGPAPDPDPTPKIDNCGWYRKALETMIECKVCLIPRGFFQAHSCPDDYPKLKKVVDLQLDVMELKAGRDFRSYPQMIAKIKERCAAEQCPDIPPEPGPNPNPKPGPKKKRKARTRMGTDPDGIRGINSLTAGPYGGDITAPDIRDNVGEEDFNAFSDISKYFTDLAKNKRRGSLFEDMTSDQQKALVKLVAERLKKQQLSEADDFEKWQDAGELPDSHSTSKERSKRKERKSAGDWYRDIKMNVKRSHPEMSKHFKWTGNNQKDIDNLAMHQLGLKLIDKKTGLGDFKNYAQMKAAILGALEKAEAAGVAHRGSDERTKFGSDQSLDRIQKTKQPIGMPAEPHEPKKTADELGFQRVLTKPKKSKVRPF